MEFELTDEHEMMRETARDFAAREVAPKAAELDRSARWPGEILTKMAELGLLGVAIPPEHGGAGMDALAYALAIEEISAACASCGVIMSVNNSLFADPLEAFGNADQKGRILAPVARGEKLGCFGLTEPMSGSDAQMMVTGAEKKGDRWVLNGAKNWITNGPHADWILVFAVTERGEDASGTPARPRLKHTAFLVERGTPGYTQGPPDHKLGIHAAHSCTVFFENCEVPEGNVLGGVGEGFKIAMATLDGGRIGIACQAIGIARAALERSVAYAKERKSFGVPIAQHQAIQFMLADMATEIDAARLLAWRAATKKDEGVRHTTESSIAKLYASEMATRVTHKAIQIHGGYGYSTELPLERHYRDARITEIYEGTSEIQRLVIAASLLR
ncbi:MAG: acyl-CoA dehydrogenase family protein [Myxococcota bacterium]|nr:acyl-CoA dehydrogenase family protein [Myxococcota bacterium]